MMICSVRLAKKFKKYTYQIKLAACTCCAHSSPPKTNTHRSNVQDATHFSKDNKELETPSRSFKIFYKQDWPKKYIPNKFKGLVHGAKLLLLLTDLLNPVAATTSNLIAMASTLLVMASNLLAMA